MISRIWQIWWGQWTLVPKIISAAIVLVFLVIGVVLLQKACSPSPPKLDEALIQKGEQAIKDGNDKELADTLIKSDVQEAAALAPANEAKVAAINAQIESTEKWGNADRETLQAEFDRRK